MEKFGLENLDWKILDKKVWMVTFGLSSLDGKFLTKKFGWKFLLWRVEPRFEFGTCLANQNRASNNKKFCKG